MAVGIGFLNPWSAKDYWVKTQGSLKFYWQVGPDFFPLWGNREKTQICLAKRTISMLDLWYPAGTLPINIFVSFRIKLHVVG